MARDLRKQDVEMTSNCKCIGDLCLNNMGTAHRKLIIEKRQEMKSKSTLYLANNDMNVVTNRDVKSAGSHRMDKVFVLDKKGSSNAVAKADSLCAFKNAPLSSRTSARQALLREKSLNGSTRVIRPVSAPGEKLRLRRKPRILSAKDPTIRYKPFDVGPEKENEDMLQVVKLAKEAKDFDDFTEDRREHEKDAMKPQDGKDVPPVFNKRLFASQGSVILTGEARRLMAINSTVDPNEDPKPFTKLEMMSLRCVTDGLRLIHKGQDYAKDVLSQVITFETYNAFQFVSTKPWESNLSCYYIVNGAVEVTYDMKQDTESRNVYQANIIYSHGTGEYVGLVSAEGTSEDLTPPATIYTKEFTQFIRVDRIKFHRLMKKAKAVIERRKRNYLSSHRSFLAEISSEVKEKILDQLSIEDYPANRVILGQGESTEYVYILMTGRCQCYREVYIPEADKDVLFYLNAREQDDFFGEECVLNKEPSYSTIITSTPITALKLHKAALQIVNKERLAKIIDKHKHEFPSDDELRDRGYRNSLWGKYKHDRIKGSLSEAGKLQYLNRLDCCALLERPPDDQEQLKENLERFILKGSQMQAVRYGSYVKPQACFPLRPKTVIPSRSRMAKKVEKPKPDQQPEQDEVDIESRPTTIMTVEAAKAMEAQISKDTILRPHIVARIKIMSRILRKKAMESKEGLLKVLDDNSELGRHVKTAWDNVDGKKAEQENFMKNGVLVTMNNEDIVRRAKALAEKYSDTQQKSKVQEEDWDTVLHAENKQAKMMLTANRIRMKALRRKLAELEKKREKENLKKLPPRQETKPSQLPPRQETKPSQIKSETDKKESCLNVVHLIQSSGTKPDNIPYPDDSDAKETNTLHITGQAPTGDLEAELDPHTALKVAEEHLDSLSSLPAKTAEKETEDSDRETGSPVHTAKVRPLSSLADIETQEKRLLMKEELEIETRSRSSTIPSNTYSVPHSVAKQVTFEMHVTSADTN